MATITLELTMDAEVVRKARLAELDIAAEVEHALRRKLDLPSHDTLRMRAEVMAQIERYNDHVDRHGLFADEWRQF